MLTYVSILSAGAFHTPQILQRSGIGPVDLLERAGITVVSNLPGVGQNFHDHGGPSLAVSVTNPPVPNADMINSNATYREEAIAAFNTTPTGLGPYTLALGNTAVYLSLQNLTSSHKEIVASIREQISSGKAISFLPPTADETVAKGYLAQLEVLANSFENPAQPVFEAPFQGPSGLGFLLKPLSRGSVLLDPNDVEGEPVITYGTFENPVDLDIVASFVPLFRKLFSTPSMQRLGVQETSPGPDVQDIDDIKDWVRNATTASWWHPCCTAGMRPRDHGGVVGTDLKVYGVEGLRVADLSIVPFLPGAHTSSSCYAIGEKVSISGSRAFEVVERVTKTGTNECVGRRHHHRSLVVGIRERVNLRKECNIRLWLNPSLQAVLAKH